MANTKVMATGDGWFTVLPRRQRQQPRRGQKGDRAFYTQRHPRGKGQSFFPRQRYNANGKFSTANSSGPGNFVISQCCNTHNSTILPHASLSYINGVSTPASFQTRHVYSTINAINEGNPSQSSTKEPKSKYLLHTEFPPINYKQPKMTRMNQSFNAPTGQHSMASPQPPTPTTITAFKSPANPNATFSQVTAQPPFPQDNIDI